MEESRLPARRNTLVLAVALYILVVALVFACTPDNDWVARQTWAVIIAGPIVIWYTWETMRLRETAIRQVEVALRQREATLQQIEVQIRPFVILEFGGNGFALKNVGVAPALNVEVQDVVINHAASVIVKFKPVFPVISPNSSSILEAVSFANGKQVGDFFAAHLEPEYAVNLLDVTVSYQNVEGKIYTVTHGIGPSRIHIRGLKTPIV
jgi:hypothetical protein